MGEIDHNPVHDEVKQFLALASGEVRLDVRSLHARRNRLQFFRSTAFVIFRALNEVERDLASRVLFEPVAQVAHEEDGAGFLVVGSDQR